MYIQRRVAVIRHDNSGANLKTQKILAVVLAISLTISFVYLIYAYNVNTFKIAELKQRKEEVKVREQGYSNNREVLIENYFDIGEEDMILLPTETYDIYEVTIRGEGQFLVKYNDDFFKNRKSNQSRGR